MHFLQGFGEIFLGRNIVEAHLIGILGQDLVNVLFLFDLTHARAILLQLIDFAARPHGVGGGARELCHFGDWGTMEN